VKALPPGPHRAQRPQARFGEGRRAPTPSRSRRDSPSHATPIPPATHPWRQPGLGVRRMQLHAHE
jgi:hypothetical protein